MECGLECAREHSSNATPTFNSLAAKHVMVAPNQNMFFREVCTLQMQPTLQSSRGCGIISFYFQGWYRETCHHRPSLSPLFGYRKRPIISPPPFLGPTTRTQKNASVCKSPPPPNISYPLANIEMNSTFYDVLKLKKANKFKKYFDKHYYEACFETPFSGSVIGLFVYQPSKNT